MEEDEINTKPVVVETKPPLAADEGEVVTQLQQKIGEVADKCLLQVSLGILILEVQEFENERVLDGLFRSDCIGRFGGCGLLQHVGLVL